MPLTSVVEAELARTRARRAGVLGAVVLVTLALAWLGAAHLYMAEEPACVVLMLLSAAQFILGIRAASLGADAASREVGGGAVVVLGLVMLVSAVLSFGFASYLYAISGLSISISLPTGC